MFLLLLNVGLFVGVAAAAMLAAWFGWKIAVRGQHDFGPGSGPGVAARVPVPWPSVPGLGATRRAGPDDLARSA